MDIESTVIERFDSAIFSWYLHNINSIQAATAENIQTLRGGAMVILQNRRKLKIHLFNHPLGYTEK